MRPHRRGSAERHAPIRRRPLQLSPRPFGQQPGRVRDNPAQVPERRRASRPERHLPDRAATGATRRRHDRRSDTKLLFDHRLQHGSRAPRAHARRRHCRRYARRDGRPCLAFSCLTDLPPVGRTGTESDRAARHPDSVARDITEHVKPPRAVFVPFRMGHHFGVPFHVAVQRQIIVSALALITTATESGAILDLTMRWTDVRRRGSLVERSRTP